jgi:hypothetical protein
MEEEKLARIKSASSLPLSRESERLLGEFSHMDTEEAE